eukprot:CAMPEP_0171212782 /NCGR_PEP_ID=MMETSP0790-20130122/30307_1 /TAXON_ID=2925 /ORGANISM="Alexandrium catenella, Strain OF101" /LENGTH=54 /DNA_ID=CAMNT_0011678471 /DNA_START=37 /DNA_END=198 /DNA_ORIENTATION=+
MTSPPTSRGMWRRRRGRGDTDGQQLALQDHHRGTIGARLSAPKVEHSRELTQAV